MKPPEEAASLVSPKASRVSYICEVGEQLEVSNEKNNNQDDDVPVAQIVIPTAARKTLLSSNTKQNLENSTSN